MRKEGRLERGRKGRRMDGLIDGWMEKEGRQVGR